MTITNFSKLEQVELRKAWANEANEFTPWLAKEENLILLGDTIGIELELEAQEKNVGPFRADILCKDTATDHWVLIENQLERTDHTHLGQLLTYASGLKAVMIVWIAKRFTEEHRAALDWLNEITDDRFNFFGLEVELWQIGGSPVAPKFNVVCKPNDWTKTVIKVVVTDTKQLQLEFWEAFRRFVEDHESRIKPTKAHPQHWMAMALGKTGFYLSAVASRYNRAASGDDSDEIRAEVIVDNQNSKVCFNQLQADADQIHSELGEELTWHNPPEKRMCRIYVRREANLDDRGSWPEYHRWLLEKLDALHRVFGPRVKRLGQASGEENGQV